MREQGVGGAKVLPGKEEGTEPRGQLAGDRARAGNFLGTSQAPAPRLFAPQGTSRKVSPSREDMQGILLSEAGVLASIFQIETVTPH